MVNLVQTNQETSTLSRSLHLTACGDDIGRRRRNLEAVTKAEVLARLEYASAAMFTCECMSFTTVFFFFKYFQSWFCTIRDLRRLKVCRGYHFFQRIQSRSSHASPQLVVCQACTSRLSFASLGSRVGSFCALFTLEPLLRGTISPGDDSLGSRFER
mmetsp:Transcript_22063/g.58342  ORF Transcript_22063/g.58342 Transcript_22063/m.58342 type:complete len:157 (+) Transcript_22063:451-921(+)